MPARRPRLKTGFFLAPVARVGETPGLARERDLELAEHLAIPVHGSRLA